MGGSKKKITPAEKKFAEYMEENGVGPIQAARKLFGWRCEPGGQEARKANNIASSERVKTYRLNFAETLNREADAIRLFTDSSKVKWDSLRKYAFNRLKHIRDDPQSPSLTRFHAVQALEKLADPTADVNLIYMWMDLLWRGMNAHCPSCHKTFPLRDIKNEALENWRETVGAEPLEMDPTEPFERRMEILKRADNRKTPHEGQIIALEALERNIVGLGSARAGKSLTLSMFGILGFLIPGVEIWILARVYKDATSEVEYLDHFLNTLFFPYTEHMVRKNYDAKTEELTLTSKWGSILKVKSAKAKGSITGRELEMALVAEPGWVPDNVYEELRSRMTSRLGRIIMLGTPKGFGGLLGRAVNLVGRDPETGRVIRLTKEQRTIAAGCPWNVSVLVYNLEPAQNPAYVQSELKAARMELTDAEYASEFEGIMASAEGARFPHIKPSHLTPIPREIYEDCVWVLGIDQGPTNFGGCLLGFDGKRVFVAREYFESDPRTMKYRMGLLKGAVPLWIKQMGGDPSLWQLTVFDSDPPIINEIDEFKKEGTPWPTDVVYKPKNIRGKYSKENWRKETYEFIDKLSAAPEQSLFFDPEHCNLLHDQMIRALVLPENRRSDNVSGHAKNWIINDPFRGDHIVDALVMAMFTILIGQLVPVEVKPQPKSVWEEAKAAFDYQRSRDEIIELGRGKSRPLYEDDELFEEHFGRKREVPPVLGNPGYYEDY